MNETQKIIDPNNWLPSQSHPNHHNSTSHHFWYLDIVLNPSQWSFVHVRTHRHASLKTTTCIFYIFWMPPTTFIAFHPSMDIHPQICNYITGNGFPLLNNPTTPMSKTTVDLDLEDPIYNLCLVPNLRCFCRLSLSCLDGEVSCQHRQDSRPHTRWKAEQAYGISWIMSASVILSLGVSTSSLAL